MMDAAVLRKVFQSLLATYGPQHWWPGETPFEVMVGAVLTQNTAWTNVEKAIANLKRKDCLDPAAIVNLSDGQLADMLRPSGYFNIKAGRLKSYCAWYLQQGGYDALVGVDTPTLRHHLLAVHGVGRETADDILLYAFNRPVFVIDAYTRRLFARLGSIRGDESYETLRHGFESALGEDAPLFNEYHALIVRHAKEVCQKRPGCGRCGLASWCPSTLVSAQPINAVFRPELPGVQGMEK
jgi:endonuclease-3 related protein